MAATCWGCREQLRKRRKLHNPANLPVLEVLSDFADAIFGSGSSRVVLPSEAVVCRSCLRSVEKLIKLRAEVLQVEEEVRVKVKQAGFLCDLQETAPSGSSVMRTPPSPRASSIMVTPTSRKRSRSHSPVNSPVAKRRAVFVNTPVQLFMSNVVPSATSPAVAVS